MLYRACMRCTEFLSGRYSVNDREGFKGSIMTKVEGGYFITEEEGRRLLEIVGISQEITKMEEEIKSDISEMNACTDCIEANMQ